MKYSTTHTAYFNANGEEVPSVTTILKILNKPFLQKWANVMGFKRQNIEDILRESAEKGTLVHQIIESYLMGRRYVWTTGRQNGKRAILYHLNSFINWKKTHIVVPEFMERYCTSSRYGGTVDFYGMVDGKATILDFKTSKKAYSSMFLQLGAYIKMLEEMGYKVEQVAIINIHVDGYKEKFMSREEMQFYIDCFTILVEFFHMWYDLNLKDGWGDILGG